MKQTVKTGIMVTTFIIGGLVLSAAMMSFISSHTKLYPQFTAAPEMSESDKVKAACTDQFGAGTPQESDCELRILEKRANDNYNDQMKAAERAAGP